MMSDREGLRIPPDVLLYQGTKELRYSKALSAGARRVSYTDVTLEDQREPRSEMSLLSLGAGGLRVGCKEEMLVPKDLVG